MAMAQASGVLCPQGVSTSCCNGKLRQPVAAVSGIAKRMDSTLRFARPSYSIGGVVDVQSGLRSSFQDVSYLKGGVTSLRSRWQRRASKGRVSCQLGAAPSDEVGSDANVSEGNDTVKFDLNLPRRSALLEFTCNACQARTQRMINPEAFRRGTVYVQCGGCQVYHQLVDNLGLVKEYDFKNEVDPLKNDLDF